MNPAKWKDIKNVLSATLDLPDNERREFLARESREEIRREVEKLLRAHENAGHLLEKPFMVEYGLNKNSFEENLIGKQIDDYLILEKIGEGGMGTVFLAEHAERDFSQKTALKLIKRGMDTNAVLKRFLMERQILAGLEHPNIARLLDGGSTAEGLPYFVMEYVEGESIKKFCEDHQFDTKERLELFLKACQAISYAHQKLVVHRDIKPSNIIVTVGGVPKLLDFGIAKLLSPDWNNSTAEATITNFRLMTPDYASPEQLRGKMTTTATDVYSLGIVLYELLTGTRPFNFKSKNPLEVAEEILTKEPLSPSSAVRRPLPHNSTDPHKQSTSEEAVNPKSGIQNPKSLRGDLDNIILKAIRKEPESRYASVQEFAEDIRRHLAGLPVTATADSTLYRVSKFVRRHRQGAAITTVISLLIFALAGLSIYQGRTAMRERDKANQRFEKLRDVAKLLMTDTQDALMRVPGTVEVQRSLAEKSVDLLDSVYDETTTDPQFLSELAESYEKLCQTQLLRFRNFEKAGIAGERAVEIRRRIIRLEPQNLQRKFELVNSLGTIAEIKRSKGDKENALRLMREVESIFRELAEKEPTDRRLTMLAFHLIDSSERYKEWEMVAESQASQKEGGDILQTLIDSYQGKELTAAEKAGLAWKLMWQAEIFQKSDNDEAAFQNYQKAAQLAESAYRADNSLQFAFNHTSRSHRRLGEIYEKRGDFQKAYEMYRFSFEWLKGRENNLAQNKANLYFGLFFYANRCALMLNRLGRQKDADAFIEKPFSDYSEFLDSEENAVNLAYAREPFLDLHKYYVETNRLEKAVEIWQRQFSRIQKFLDKNPDDLGFMVHQIETQNQIGGIYAVYDEKSDSFKTNDRELLKKAELHYEKAAELYRNLQMKYTPTQAEKETFQKIAKKIEKLGKLLSALK